MICCYERSTFLPLKRQDDQISERAAKAQHEPQNPWSLTGETMPFYVQFTFFSREKGKNEERTGFEVGLGDSTKTCPAPFDEPFTMLLGK